MQGVWHRASMCLSPVSASRSHVCATGFKVLAGWDTFLLLIFCSMSLPGLFVAMTGKMI